MSTSEEYISIRTKLLGEKILTNRIPYTNDTHRKVIDLIKKLKSAGRLAKELEVILELPVLPSVITYFELVRDE